MADQTLLLNSTYEPLKVITWQRAVTMLYLGKVELVRSYDRMRRAVSWRIKTPAVVRLVRFVRRHRTRIAFSRRNVFLRDGYRCMYCNMRFPPSELTCDHVQPRSRGGGTNWENVVSACGPCNRRKGNRRPEEARMRLRNKPVRPRSLPAPATRIGGEASPPIWRDFLPL